MWKLIIFIVCYFFILFHFKKVEQEKEFFQANLKQFKIEGFEDEIPSVKDMSANEANDANDANDANEANDANDANEDKVSEESYEKPIDKEQVNTQKKNEAVETSEVCQKKGEKGEGCLFGCPKNEVSSPPIPSKKVDFNEMLMTIEETEKICDLIEEKDRIRKEKEDEDSLKKQIELNRKFLIQQKAQDKQIKDLEGIIKSMSFTQEMNKAAVEKCGQNSDDDLSEKERKLKELLLKKQVQQKSVKVNVNFKDFGKEFMGHMMNNLGLNNVEMQKLSEAINNGSLDIEQLKNQLGYPNSNHNSNSTPYMDNDDCPSCDVDLTEYIDRCKIPCHKCRDPKWKCPQDIRN